MVRALLERIIERQPASQPALSEGWFGWVGRSCCFGQPEVRVVAWILVDRPAVSGGWRDVAGCGWSCCVDLAGGAGDVVCAVWH